MKTRSLLFILAILGGLAYALLFVACEEKLDACQPCGSVLDGQTNISGDPRVDGTFGAIQTVRDFARNCANSLETSNARLIHAFALPDNASVAEIVTAIDEQLLQAPGATVTMHMVPATCWVDAAFARDLELSCEEHSECRISTSCIESPMSPYCNGFYTGSCTENSCAGDCFENAQDENVACQELCMGVCDGMDAGVCPGSCFGDCSGTCSAYNLNGSCSGYCDSACTGYCSSNSAFPCTGQCENLCRVLPGEDLSCDGACLGTCLNDAKLPTMSIDSDTGDVLSTCRGHVRPVGCDPDPACSECREIAIVLAWSVLQCSSASVQVRVDIADAANPNNGSLIDKARVVEDVLQKTADDYAKLALWVDGTDVKGELQPENLSMSMEQDPGSTALEELGDPDYVAELGVVDSRKFFPLSYLKARIGILRDTATSGRLFNIAAVPLRCVSPALDDAKTILDQLIPVVEVDAGLAPARDCPDPQQDAVAPCLYRIVDEQQILLGLTDAAD